MAASDLGRRSAVAAVGIPLVVAALYVGGWVLGLLLAGAAAIGTIELHRLAEARGARPFPLIGAGLAAAFVLLASAYPDLQTVAPLFWGATLIATLFVAAAAIWLRGASGNPLGAISITITAAILLGGTLSCGVFLRYLPLDGAAPSRWTGTALAAFPLALTWIADSGAYFGGRTLGRRKLMPTVSPAKTVEGAIAGVAAAVLAGAFLGWLLRAWLGLDLTLLEGAAGGALLGVVAQVGDLAESLLKREAQVKDSGRLFPGHGGLLDRVDSLLFAVPAAFWYLGAVL